MQINLVLIVVKGATIDSMLEHHSFLCLYVVQINILCTFYSWIIPFIIHCLYFQISFPFLTIRKLMISAMLKCCLFCPTCNSQHLKICKHHSPIIELILSFFPIGLCIGSCEKDCSLFTDYPNWLILTLIFFCIIINMFHYFFFLCQFL